jgi:hypothetical protein
MNELLAIFSANLYHCITADQTHPLHFLVGTFCFGGCILMITLGSKENGHNFLLLVTLFINDQSTN